VRNRRGRSARDCARLRERNARLLRIAIVEVKELQDILCEFRRVVSESGNAKKMALATLVRSRGSSYRRPGARMLIVENGFAVGALSGGCLEEEIVRRALEVMRCDKSCLFTLDTRLRFGCNGAIDIFIEPIDAKNEFLAAVARCIETRQPFVAATAFGKPDEARLGTFVIDENDAFFSECENETASVFIQKIEPPIQLVIAGDGPENAALKSFASILGWRVLETENVSENLAQIAFDSRTAALVKTHSYGRDFAFLKKLLPMRLRYVGLVGPKKRREQLLNDLIDGGFVSAADESCGAFAGFHAPAGLDLSAESPEQIALSIVAEIQAVFAGGSCVSLRNRRSPIHERRDAARAHCETRMVRCVNVS